MAEPTFTLSIDRTSLSLSALLVSGDESQPLSLVTFTPPAWVGSNTYAADSPWLDWSTVVSSRWEHTAMGGTLRVEGTSEADLQANVTAFRTALGRLTYDATVTTNGVAETWECDHGSLSPLERDYADLRRPVAFYTFTIPCKPGGA